LIIELEKQKAELEQFTLTISHDLKSPLITIKGFLTMLEQDIAKGELQRANADITRILNAADKMRILLDNLLKLSRIGRVVNPSQNVPLKDIVHDALDLVAGRIAKKKVRVEVTTELPHVYVDRHRMIEVFQNLIDNAVKYMGDEPNPHIEIGARYDNGETVCYIRDNGIGIAPRYQERIFGLFDKLDQQSDGTGLGLAVVRRIIDVHGGRIWVESQGIGQGASFCFTVPTQKDVANYEK
ncbi:MAG: GHKL domain-containing protein, partial [Candidatus Omnitrophica bacterium]|nr:GHKL domain-containing protein [Candidatus Omnitrophota bacterium]